jgi:hypothetical protein
MRIPLSRINTSKCLSTPVLHALEAGSDYVETIPNNRFTQLTKPIKEMTPDEAATLVDWHGRGWAKLNRNVQPGQDLPVYDNLLMRASNPEFFDDDPPGQPQKARKSGRKSERKSLQLLCQGGCGKHFPAARRSAKYCSDACTKRAYRDRRMSRLRPAKTDPQCGSLGVPDDANTGQEIRGL